MQQARKVPGSVSLSQNLNVNLQGPPSIPFSSIPASHPPWLPLPPSLCICLSLSLLISQESLSPSPCLGALIQLQVELIQLQVE